MRAAELAESECAAAAAAACAIIILIFANALGLVLAKKVKNYSMQYSHVVSHHSTDCTNTSLTSGIGRDPVLSGVYGRSYNCLGWYRLYFVFAIKD